MKIIYLFEGELNVTEFSDFEYDSGHIVLSMDDICIISSSDNISYNDFTYFCWKLYLDGKLDLSEYNFICCED